MYGYLYILYSPSRDKYYIGASTQPGERLKRHNAGYSKSTGSGRPWTLVYLRQYSDLSEAMKEEYRMKRQKRRTAVMELQQAYIASPWPLP